MWKAGDCGNDGLGGVTAMRSAAILAIIVGFALAGFETLVNWGHWQWWPWWLVDYVGALLLVAGGISTLQGKCFGTRLLATAWGFSIGMAWMSMAGNIADGTDPARQGRVAGFYVALIGLHIATCLAGLVATVFGRDD
jgi:hypothetical protein